MSSYTAYGTIFVSNVSLRRLFGSPGSPTVKFAILFKTHLERLPTIGFCGFQGSKLRALNLQPRNSCVCVGYKRDEVPPDFAKDVSEGEFLFVDVQFTKKNSTFAVVMKRKGMTTSAIVFNFPQARSWNDLWHVIDGGRSFSMNMIDVLSEASLNGLHPSAAAVVAGLSSAPALSPVPVFEKVQFKPTQCEVCFDGVADVLFSPCNHNRLCRLCAKAWDGSCPLCRQPIRGIMKLHLPVYDQCLLCGVDKVSRATVSAGRERACLSVCSVCADKCVYGPCPMCTDRVIDCVKIF